MAGTASPPPFRALTQKAPDMECLRAEDSTIYLRQRQTQDYRTDLIASLYDAKPGLMIVQL